MIHPILRHNRLWGDWMEEARNGALHDPKLPAIHAAAKGNGMEQHRRSAPLPADLADVLAQRNCTNGGT